MRIVKTLNPEFPLDKDRSRPVSGMIICGVSAGEVGWASVATGVEVADGGRLVAVAVGFFVGCLVEGGLVSVGVGVLVAGRVAPG